jgi:hypothetical protein
VISITGFTQEETWSPAEENTLIVSEQEFFTRYEATTEWKHIVRLKKENPSIVLQDLQNVEDFASLRIPLDSPKAYKLYTGDFVIFSIKSTTVVE